ncbi:MAG: ATP-dependent DNA helicase [Rhodobacteraceae bacterium]|nr:ATP-dependent DNA helicase [Paracoccaceae bacterium]
MTVPSPDRRIVLPPMPVLAADWADTAILHPSGELEVKPTKSAGHALGGSPVLVCHAPATLRRLGNDRIHAADILELFAFVRPAQFCVPTPDGIALATGQPHPKSLEDRPAAIAKAALTLLGELATLPEQNARLLRSMTASMMRARWIWGPSVMQALGGTESADSGYGAGAGLRVWVRLPEWQDRAPPPPPGNEPVDGDESEQRLRRLLGSGSEDRVPQVTFARELAYAFTPREAPETPQVVLAEAGTGVGKTLGYIAPASVWAEKNEGAVWISTFTRNLQRQLDTELKRLHPDPDERKRRVVIRKGRENYVCILNYEDAVNRLNANPHEAIGVGLIARWLMATNGGDMIGGDLPGWLPEIMGRERIMTMADRRGECVYAACQHFQKCFIERTVRRARYADIVVANHALVMVQAALGGLDDATRPSRYVFDEGHHIFEAADGAFSAHLSGWETAELRRWLIGADERSRSRARGLKRRAEDLITAGSGDAGQLSEAVEQVVNAAQILPGTGWRNRVHDGQTHGPAEAFLALVRSQVYARADTGSPYSLETETTPPVDGLIDAASELDEALRRLEAPVKRLVAGLRAKLDTDAEHLDTGIRVRIEALIRALERRALMQITAWRDMLAALSTATPPEFVDWLSVERSGGHDMDVGLHRHWLDPTLPFARAIADNAHGIAVTSATLLDGSGDETADWATSESRAGITHLGASAHRIALPSPFNYFANTRVLVITDVRKDDLSQVASAYRELFIAAGGGGLGLFTAIARLREVQKRIAAPLEHAGLPLYAQHVDEMDTSTLVDIFRAEENACLLGTDALREGVDVPGRALRLVVFDRVPWPRPDILHKARRTFFGKRTYDDAVTRLRLKQAFGRLIRRNTDRGVFVLLDPMMPSRLKGAFPADAPYERVGIADAIGAIKGFLGR